MNGLFKLDEVLGVNDGEILGIWVEGCLLIWLLLVIFFVIVFKNWFLGRFKLCCK